MREHSCQLNNCVKLLSLVKFINTHLSHYRQWFNIHFLNEQVITFSKLNVSDYDSDCSNVEVVAAS